jgi:tRNA pseudouridine55 synthase
MPKSSSGPLSAIFAINKPSGIPSMTLLNQLQPLFQSSQLFKDQAQIQQQQQEEDNAGKGKGKGQGRRRKWKDEKVKMGQGGTLDPLADGVLGAFPFRPSHSLASGEAIRAASKRGERGLATRRPERG